MTRLVLACVLALGMAPVLPAPAPETAPFLMGVLRRDGFVLPFAAWDGKRWGTPWPADIRAQDLPIGLEDVPERWWGKPGPQSALVRWADGSKHGTVALERPVRMPVMCSVRMALRSDYKSKDPLPPPFEQPFPKDGLLVSGDQTVLALPAVPRSSSEWSSSAVVLLPEFNKMEDAAIASFTAWRHPVSRGQRARMPIEVEALYRVPMDEEGWAAYYIEAIRRYPPGPDDEGCGLVTFASGWIRLGPKGRPLFDIGARVTYCDRKGAGYMLPLGVLTLDGKAFWVYQMSGHDREWYVVARPTPRAIELHVEYAAGLCPFR